jgi:hypothetical protein
MQVFCLCTILVMLWSDFDPVEGFSSVAGMRIRIEQHRSSTSLNVERLNVRSESPGSELFPGKGPYVPSGLSAEQYSKIKKDEEEKMKRMNFAAWGPRFKRSEVPAGDWMVMPYLWTNGFNAPRPRGHSDYFSEKTTIPPIVSRTAFFVREKIRALLLAFILLDTLTTAFAMCKSPNLTAKQAAILILRAQPFANGLARIPPIKIMAAKLLVAASLIPVMEWVLETINRRWLWSTRRTICTSMVASSVSLVGLAIVARLVVIATSVLT